MVSSFGGPHEQIVDPRCGVNDLAALLSTPVGARTVNCCSNITLADVIACLRGGIIFAVFTSALFLAAARNFMLNVLMPAGTHSAGFWSALEPALWACVGTSCVLFIIYSLDSKKSLTIDPFGLIVNTQVHEGVDSRLLIPWHWLSKVSVKKPRFAFGGTEFHLETKYGMVYTLRWDEVLTSTVTETLIAVLRTLAPQAELDMESVERNHSSTHDSFTELWLQGLSRSVPRERIGMLSADTVVGAGRYRIVGIMGAGGQGTVYLAMEEIDRVEVVLKEYILPAHTAQDALDGSQSRIGREIELLKSLDHCRIAKLVDFFSEDYRGYLVFEYVKGSQLKELVQTSGPLDEATVAGIGIQTCQLLEYLHPKIVHRDITPHNLILQESGEVKLVDFNVARSFASEGASIVVVGKHAYIPPEQFRGRATAQSDIYGLGCTMHFLLTGEDPEPMTTSHPARVDGKVSKQIDRIVAKATALELSSRYSCAAEFAADLREVLEPSFMLTIS